mgnify:CR=1 FL=1
MAGRRRCRGRLQYHCAGRRGLPGHPDTRGRGSRGGRGGEIIRVTNLNAEGLYKLAREGKIKEFTGISDPYEMPENPELRLETENTEVDNCAHQVILKLEQMGLIRG